MALNNEVLCHFWFYPDSHDTWLNRENVEAEPEAVPKRGTLLCSATEREIERGNVCKCECECVFVCVSVSEWVSERRWRERGRDREEGKKRGRERERYNNGPEQCKCEIP